MDVSGQNVTYAAGVDLDVVERIRQLKRANEAVIIAHNYQPPAVQDLADFVGDSLAMARWAAASSARTLIVAGVYFMAETAAILCPNQRILIPDLEAGCSLADSITVEQLCQWKAEHPGAVVVSYVNTSAAIKACSDYCCTSSNAVQVVEAIDPDREVLFLPDFYLGSHVARVTKRSNLHVWLGECHVHAAIDPEEMSQKVAAHPNSELLVHPECGCTTKALALPAKDVTTHILSTDGMMAHVRQSRAHTFVVATEIGLLHRLRQEHPHKAFVPASDDALCPYMNLITVEKIERALVQGQHEVVVPEPMRSQALRPLERMVAIGR